MRDDVVIFFKSYNSAMEAACDACLKAVQNGIHGGYEAGRECRISKDYDGAFRVYMKKAYEQWLAAPLETPVNMTPTAFLQKISNFNEIAAMFEYGSAVCDDELPEIFIDKLFSFGDETVCYLIETACKSLSDRSEEEFMPQIAAVTILGKQRTERAVKPLIGVLDAGRNEAYELMNETVRDALINIGTAAVECIISELDSGKHSAASMEYLLMALAQIGKDNRSDRIYSRLKGAFLDMPQKIIAASCLASYGDGRAISALRGYLLKNNQSVDKETFYEIVAAVKMLGGNTDDLKLQG